MALAREHSHSVVENIAATLNTLIQPGSSMTLLVDWNRESLTSAVVYCIDYGYVEFLRMLRQMVSTRHSCSASARSSESPSKKLTSRSCTNNQHPFSAIFTLAVCVVRGRHICDRQKRLFL
jgi:hypothetical protein